MIIYCGIRQNKFCVSYFQNRVWTIKLHVYFLKKQRILKCVFLRLKYMLEPLCFQTAFEQHVNNRLVYSKLFCGREWENIKLRAELLFQYNPRQYEIFNVALLP